MLRFILLLSALLYASKPTILSPQDGDTLKCDSTYTVRWERGSASSGSYVYLYLLSLRGASLRINDKYSNSGQYDSLRFTVPPFFGSTDSIRMKVEDNNNGTDTSGYFRVVQERPDIYEPNNDSSHAYKLIIGDSLAGGHLSVFNDDDWFKCDLSAGDYVDFIVHSRKSTINYHFSANVYGPNGFHFYQADWTGSAADSVYNKFCLRASSTGTYYFRLNNSYGYYGRYSLVLKQHAGDISLHLPFGMNTFSSDSTYVFSWSGSNVPNPVGLWAFSTTPDAKAYYFGNFYSDHTIEVKFPPVNSTIPLRFAVTEYYSGFSPLSDTSAVCTLVQSRPDAYEPNNDTAHAYTIFTGDSLSDAVGAITFQSPRDTDYYCFNGTAGDLVDINVGYAGSNHYYQYFDNIDVITPSGRVYFHDGYRDTITHLRLGIPENGKYFIRVTPWSGNCSRYFITYRKVWKAGYDVLSPSNGDIWACDTFNTIKWTNHNMGFNVGVDICLDGIHWVNLASQQNNLDTLRCLFPPLQSTYDQVRLRLHDAGSIGLTLYDTSAPFTLRVGRTDPYEPNNSASTAFLLHSGDSLSGGYIYFPPESTVKDTDWFVFNALKGDTITFRFTGPANGLKGEILQSFDYQLLTTIYSWIFAIPAFFIMPKSGNYFLRVRGWSDFDYGHYVLSYRNSSGSITDCGLSVTLQDKDTVLNAGFTCPITWTSYGAVSHVKLLLFKDDQFYRIADSIPNTGNFAFTIPYVRDTSSVYRIAFQSADTFFCGQNLSSPFRITGSPEDPYEPNNDTGQAFAITSTDTVLLGGCFPITFSGESQDLDYFSFFGVAGDTVTISTWSDTAQAAMAGALTLYTTDGVSPFRTNIHPMDSCHIVQGLPSSGKYFILHRSGSRESNGKYRLSFSRKLGLMALSGISTEPIRELTFFQCGPNPFNPAVKIEIGIPPEHAALSTMTVHDISGRICRQWSFNKDGRQSVLWDAHDNHQNPLSSGVYLLRLSDGKKTFIKRLLLTK